ncbi:uncharacterized protein METZ01_LOCUS268371, partial [marine metagenome]
NRIITNQQAFIEFLPIYFIIISGNLAEFIS